MVTFKATKKIKQEFTVSVDVLGWIEGKVEEFNKRAEKLEMPTIDLIVKTKPYKKDEDNSKETPKVDIQINGEIPQVDGWEIVAVIDHTIGETKNGVRTAFEDNLPEKYYTRDNVCDHCNYNRNRHETYVLYNEEDDEYKQVGSNCLKDFVSSKSVNSMVNYADYAKSRSDIMKYLYDTGRIRRQKTKNATQYIDLKTYLSFVDAYIQEYGWSKSRSANATKTLADLTMHSHGEPFTGQRNIEPQYPNNKNRERAQEAIDWVLSLDEDEINNNYMNNIYAICESGYFNRKLMGYAASIPVAHYNAMEREEEERKRKREAAKSDWVFEEGERVEFEVDLKDTKTFPTRFGTTCLHIMKDENDNEIIWFASEGATWINKVEWDEDNVAKVAEKFKVRATVKEHKEYEGKKQTVVNRLKVLERHDMEHEQAIKWLEENE